MVVQILYHKTSQWRYAHRMRMLLAWARCTLGGLEEMEWKGMKWRKMSVKWYRKRPCKVAP